MKRQPPEMGFCQVQVETGWGRALARFADWCQAQPGWRVLDVGCGPGLLPALFAGQGCRAVGLDLNLDSFRPQRLHSTVVVGGALRLPFSDETFDLVTASNLLFLLPDPPAALQEMRRVVQPQGRLAVLNPSEQMSVAAAAELAEQRGLQGLSRQSLLQWAQRAEYNFRWSADELAALLADAGWSLDETTLRVGPGLARLGRARRMGENFLMMRGKDEYTLHN